MPGFHSHDDDFLFEFQRAADFRCRDRGGATAGNTDDQPEAVGGERVKNRRISVGLSPTQFAGLKRISRLRRTSVSALVREAIAATFKKNTD